MYIYMYVYTCIHTCIQRHLTVSDPEMQPPHNFSSISTLVLLWSQEKTDNKGHNPEV